MVKGERKGARSVRAAHGAHAEVEDITSKDNGVSEKSDIAKGAVFDWTMRLRSNDPSPVGDPWDFIVASRWQEAGMPRETFTKRLRECLETLGMRTPLPADVEKMLFDQAIEDRQMRAAYDAFKELLQGDRFIETLKYVLRELERLDKCSVILHEPRSVAVPPGVSRWETFWIGNLRDLTDTILGQLYSAKEELEFMKEFLRMRRTDVVSYLLEGAHLHIKVAIKSRKLRISIHKLLVAYAHASELLPYKEGEPVEAMKNRLSRVKKPSAIKTGMRSLLLLQHIKIDVAAIEASQNPRT